MAVSPHPGNQHCKVDSGQQSRRAGVGGRLLGMHGAGLRGTAMGFPLLSWKTRLPAPQRQSGGLPADLASRQAQRAGYGLS